MSTKCPICGSNGLVLLWDFYCENKKCSNYVVTDDFEEDTTDVDGKFVDNNDVLNDEFIGCVLPRWLPIRSAINGGESFYGIDRSSDVERFAGVFMVGGSPEILLSRAIKRTRENGSISMFGYVALLHQSIYDRLSKIRSISRYVISHTCPKNEMYVLDLGTWRRTSDTSVQIDGDGFECWVNIDVDGKFDNSDTAGGEWVCCTAPSHNARLIVNGGNDVK